MLTLACAEHEPVEVAVRQAFARIRSANATDAIVELPARQRADRALVPVLAAELNQTPTLERLVLVHPSAFLGFLVSTLNLQVPRVRAQSCATVEQARALLEHAAPG